MFDLGISKLVLIGVVALIVIGPEKLPRVARTVGALLGKAQRYVNDVKAEVNRSMDLDELRKVKASVEQAAREVETSVRTHANDFQQQFDGLDGSGTGDASAATAGRDGTGDGLEDASKREFVTNVVPAYQPPRKNWRKRRSAVPHWYKTRHQVRSHVQSGAARVARHRPAGIKLPR
ncbi:Sec-independent protein translocase subunit TatB [Corticibacter populi]|uniref:Sec-independent protein translocase protein TatB n=1 Tax=Corticibacter populi TaxID=1550736 RepID=A0A3M6QXP9_9BURK|nr:Sec-independent protein translocase protein TatB [Corticibacter populi]RMX07800.1 Sec-independent protein translocase subunit TatB [Corticibacter populi]RZS35026.1 sec-independent protein translocase protein TatB [Corticibacter populi]